MTATKRFIWPALITLLYVAGTQAENSLPRPNWDRDLALQTARLNADDHELRQWLSIARAGESQKLLQRVSAYSASGQTLAPARERQLYLLALKLADLPPAEIPEELIDLLEMYTPQTLVANEEDATTAVPLFNIPAAARGLRHTMERKRGFSRSATLLKSNPDEWIGEFLSATTSVRGGFLSALEGASDRELEILQRMSLQSLGRHPALSAVAARTALALDDQAALLQVVVNARGPALAPMLRSAAATSSRNERAILLLTAVSSAPPENGALAIALLAPGLRDVSEVTSSLFELLEDRSLGSSAALALSHHPDPEVRQRLNSVAVTRGPAGRRARMALDLARPGSRQ